MDKIQTMATDTENKTNEENLTSVSTCGMCKKENFHFYFLQEMLSRQVVVLLADPLKKLAQKDFREKIRVPVGYDAKRCPRNLLSFK